MNRRIHKHCFQELQRPVAFPHSLAQQVNRVNEIDRKSIENSSKLIEWAWGQRLKPPNRSPLLSVVNYSVYCRARKVCLSRCCLFTCLNPGKVLWPPTIMHMWLCTIAAPSAAQKTNDNLYSYPPDRRHNWDAVCCMGELLQLMNIFKHVQCCWNNFRTLLAAEIILFQFQTWLHVQ